MLRLSRTAITLVLAVMLVAAACDNSGDETTSTTVPSTTSGSAEPGGSTTTTVPRLDAIPGEDVPGTHSPSIPDDVDLTMRDQIGELIIIAEQQRALPFLEIPMVTILDEAEFTARVTEQTQDEIDPVDSARDQAFLELMGMLDGDTDLADLLVSLYAEQVAGFYDPDEGEIVVPAANDGFSAYQKVTLVHELIHALTDQHFDFNDELERRFDDGTGDEVSSILAMVEGDATYQQFVYFEGLDPAEAVDAAMEILSFESTVLDDAPSWIGMDLAFPYEQGLIFINAVVADDGLKGVDEVYQDPPTTTEQILEPRKYLRREVPTPLDPVAVTLPGWDVHEDGAFGEWGVRLLLEDTVTPGVATQAAAGWDNDSYRVLVNGDDVAMAWSYLAESDQDAEDLVNALIAHARGPMGAASSRESGGGLLFEGGGVYIFIDRIDDSFVFVASTDTAAGESLRSQMGV